MIYNGQTVIPKNETASVNTETRERDIRGIGLVPSKDCLFIANDIAYSTRIGRLIVISRVTEEIVEELKRVDSRDQVPALIGLGVLSLLSDKPRGSYEVGKNYEGFMRNEGGLFVRLDENPGISSIRGGMFRELGPPVE